MSFTYKTGAGANAAGSSSTIAAAGVSVAAGDLVVVAVKHEGATATVTCSDSLGSTWTRDINDTGVSSAEPWLSMHHCIAASTGTMTVTASFGSGRVYRDIMLQVFTPSGTVSVDGTPVAAGGHSAGIGALSSGNTTTTGIDGLSCGGYGEYGLPVSNPTVNGVAVTATQGSGGSTRSSLSYLAYSAGFTGAFVGDFGSANNWVMGLVNFQISAAGGRPSQATSFLLGGVQ